MHGSVVVDPLKMSESEKQSNPGRKRDFDAFKKSRMSYASPQQIRRANESLEARRKLSLRHKSRFYSLSADQTDLLNPKSRVKLVWKDLKLVVQGQQGLLEKLQKKPPPQPKTLFEGATGMVSPGEMYAIMGPTGSGKTSLLKALAGISGGTVYGEIYANGRKREWNWGHAISFIEDSTSSLNPLFTVRESLEFVAKLCLPEKYPEDEKKARIEHCLISMGLERIADSRIGTPGSGSKCISGGERKRLCIALELMREPKIIFLDEPTSGLDAATAKSIISYMHQLAIVDSLTIIMTVHQPRLSVLSKFETICLLAKGRPVFCGTVDGAIDFFADIDFQCDPNDNPAEYFLDVIGNISKGNSKMTLSELREAWEENSTYYMVNPRIDKRSQSLTVETKGNFDYSASSWTEIKTLFMREHVNKTRSYNYLFYMLKIFILRGLLIGFLWFQMSKTEFSGIQDRVGIVQTVPSDRAILGAVGSAFGAKARTKRERRNSMYRASSMYIALFLATLPTAIFIALIYFTMIYYLSALRYTPFTAYLIYISYSVLHSLVGMFIGFSIGLYVDDYLSALMTGCIFIIVTRLFNGGTVNLNNITWILRWISFVSPVFYATQGLAQNEFDGQILNGRPGEFWLNRYALNLISKMWCAGGLMIYLAFVVTLGFFLFHGNTRPSFNLNCKPH